MLSPCTMLLVSLWPFVSWPALPQTTSHILSCRFISLLWHSVHYPHMQQKDNLCQGQRRLIASFRKNLHYHMLILVQVRSKGDVLPVKQRVCGFFVVLSSLGVYIAQAQASSYRTSVYEPESTLYLRRDFISGGFHWGIQDRVGWTGRKKGNRDLSPLVFHVLSTYHLWP